MTPKIFEFCASLPDFLPKTAVFPLDDEAANRRISFFSPDRPVSVEKKKHISPVYNTKSIFTWSKKFLLFSFFEGSVIFPVFQTANRRMDLSLGLNNSWFSCLATSKN